MALTKKDLSQIKGVVHGEVESAVETLARIVNRQFGIVGKQIELIDKRIEKIEAEIRHINAEIRKHFVYRDEFEEVLLRLSVIEKKLGIRVN